MSKIEKQLAEATEVTRKRGEADQDYMKRLVKAISELDDKAWEGLSPEAQNWFNDAADNLNKKKDLPDFPDATKADEKKEETVSRRRRSADDEESPETPADPKVGDEVKVITKRGKTITGKVVEIDGDMLVIDDGDGEVEVSADKTESVEITKAAAGKSSKKDDAKADKGKDEGGKAKKISTKANGGVSATGRMRELICEDPSMSKEDIAAKVKKEGLEFRDNTLDLVYADAQKIIGILRDLNKLK